jgi:hypothetical protein
MAVAIIGGQLLCLLLTLLVTPVVYSYFDGLRAWRPGDLLALLRRKKPGGAIAPALAQGCPCAIAERATGARTPCRPAGSSR